VRKTEPDLEAAAVTLFFASRFCLRRSTTSSVGGTEGRRFLPRLPEPSAPCMPDVDPEAAAPATDRRHILGLGFGSPRQGHIQEYGPPAARKNSKTPLGGQGPGQGPKDANLLQSSVQKASAFLSASLTFSDQSCGSCPLRTTISQSYILRFGISVMLSDTPVPLLDQNFDHNETWHELIHSIWERWEEANVAATPPPLFSVYNSQNCVNHG